MKLKKFTQYLEQDVQHRKLDNKDAIIEKEIEELMELEDDPVDMDSDTMEIEEISPEEIEELRLLNEGNVKNFITDIELLLANMILELSYSDTNNLIQKYSSKIFKLVSATENNEIDMDKFFDTNGDLYDDKTYLVKLKPNIYNKSKWYYKNDELVGETFTVINGHGDFKNHFATETKGGSGGTYHFSIEDVDILKVKD